MEVVRGLRRIGQVHEKIRKFCDFAVMGIAPACS